MRHACRYYSHAVSLWQATAGPETGQQTVLQIDDGLADFFVPAQQVVVVHCDLQIFVLWQVAGQLEHPQQSKKSSYGTAAPPSAKNSCESKIYAHSPSNFWIESIWLVVIPVIHGLPPQ